MSLTNKVKIFIKILEALILESPTKKNKNMPLNANVDENIFNQRGNSSSRGSFTAELVLKLISKSYFTINY